MSNFENQSFVEELSALITSSNTTTDDIRRKIETIVQRIFDAGYDEAYSFYGGDSYYEDGIDDEDDEIILGYDDGE